ncbi:hypothetical protein IGI92_001604 [Enterococcus sp. DIV2379]|uniref:DUF7278 family profilin-like fold-containing protein n=1 Tax=Enterococcus sp. DIV2379 TaxID=2774684 RepID=UPI003D30083B
MDFFEALQWSNWKTLSFEIKEQLIQQILMYFVSPLKEITDVHFSQLTYAGLKCATFELTIDGEDFVFIPGNSEAILGWDLGVQGLPATCWSKNWQSPPNEIIRQLETIYELETSQDWGIFVNESTSPLRKAVIDPMLVQKSSLPAGARYIGQLNTITGEFHGLVDQFSVFEKELKAQFTAPASFEESLRWELPAFYHEENRYFAALEPLSETYQLFTHESVSQTELKQQLDKQGFQLLSEDQWEYVCGAATRRLFRWGNEKSCDDGVSLPTAELLEPNLFGCTYGLADAWELTDGLSLKMENWQICGHPLFDALPYASYYRSRKMLQPDQKLSPQSYRYRKAILINRDRI